MSNLETGSIDEYSTRQLRKLLLGLEAVRRGDLTTRLEKEQEDIFGELAVSYNGMVELIGGLANEFSRVAEVAGKKGELEERAAYARARNVLMRVCLPKSEPCLRQLPKPLLSRARVGLCSYIFAGRHALYLINSSLNSCLTGLVRVKCLSLVCSLRPILMQIEAISTSTAGRGSPFLACAPYIGFNVSVCCS